MRIPEYQNKQIYRHEKRLPYDDSLFDRIQTVI